MLSACASTNDRLGATSRVDPHTVAAYHADQNRFYHDDKPPACALVKPYNDYNYGAIDLDCYRFPDNTIDGADGSGKTAYQLATESMADRNRLIAILLKQSDNICTIEMGRFTSRSALVGAGFGVATTILAGVATIVTGQTAKSILAGGATIASGTRDQIDADVYQHQVGTAIRHAIANERAQLAAKIRGHFMDSLVKWPIDLAIVDIDAYHQQCSFYQGLDLVLTSVDAKKTGTGASSDAPPDPISTLIDQLTAKAAATTTAIDDENKKAVADRDQKQLASMKAELKRDNDLIAALKKMQGAPASK